MGCHSSIMSLASSLSLVLLASAAVSASVSAPQVQATAYTESLCPDCIGFIGGSWWDVWNTPGVGYGTSVGDGLGIVSFDQVVFGNAKIDPVSGNITCQHGADECTFNVLQVFVQFEPTCSVSLVVSLFPFSHSFPESDFKTSLFPISTGLCNRCGRASGFVASVCALPRGAWSRPGPVRRCVRRRRRPQLIGHVGDRRVPRRRTRSGAAPSGRQANRLSRVWLMW